jgi:hypothetical protein
VLRVAVDHFQAQRLHATDDKRSVGGGLQERGWHVRKDGERETCRCTDAATGRAGGCTYELLMNKKADKKQD